MKIAFDAYPIASPQLSGVGIHALSIAGGIAKSGNFDCELLLYDFLRHHGSAKILGERIPGVPILQNNLLPYGVYAEIWNAFPISYNRLFGSDADIFHFFNFVVPPKVRGKIINTVHDLVFCTFPETMDARNRRRMLKNVRRSCDMADIIITVSENSGRELTEFLGIPKEKIRVVYNGVNHAVFNQNAPTDTEIPLPEDYILYIGTLEPRKNLVTLLKAFAQTNAAKNGIKLVIAGAKGWEYDEIYKMAANLKTEVTFTGYVPSNELPALYRRARAFAFPSLYEGFGIPPLEAMACGTPVVTTRSSSLPEVVGSAAATVSDPASPDELAAAIDRAVSDEDFRKKCISEGLLRAKRFTWEKSCESVMKIYKELE